MSNSFFSAHELTQIGLRSYGKNVLISRKASFYSPSKIILGNHVRIDDFCILSGHITIGSHVHISAFSALYGRYGIKMEDYTGLSPRCLIFSAMDDFSGEYLIGPMVDKNKTHVSGGKVHIKKYSQIGAGSILFPNIIIEEGVVVGALSMVNYNLEAWKIYAGIPVRIIKNRENKLLLLDDKL
jgi:acetyltransferase-like isoleucine patch superfamily enzyme